MGSRSRDAANRDKRFSSEPESTTVGGGSASNPNILDSVQYDELSSTSATPGSGARMIVPLGTTGGLASHTGRLVDWNGSSATVVTPTELGARVYSEEQMQDHQYHLMPGPGVLGRPVGTSKLSSWFAYLPNWLADTFWSRFQESVISSHTDPATALTTNFSRYLIGAGASGVWSTHVGKIAMAVADTGGAGAVHWVFIAPREGMLLWNEATNKFMFYDGSNWVNLEENIELAMTDLTDVSGSPSTGDSPVWDGTQFVFQTPGSGHNIGDHLDTNLGTPGAGQDGYAIVWDNAASEYVLAAVAGSAHALGSHSDTNLGTPGAGQDGWSITWDNAASEYILSPAGGVHGLGSHSDTNFGTPGAGQNGWSVVWDNSAGEFVLSNAGGPHSLDSHSNVNFTGKITNSQIRWNGTDWVAFLPTLDDLNDVVISSPTAGQGLVYNGSNWVNGTITATVTAKAASYQGGGGTSWVVIGGSVYRMLNFSTAILANSTLRPSNTRFQADTTGKWRFRATVVVSYPNVNWNSVGNSFALVMELRKGAGGTHTGGSLISNIDHVRGGTGGSSPYSVIGRDQLTIECIMQLNSGEHLEVVLWAANNAAINAWGITYTQADFQFIGV